MPTYMLKDIELMEISAVDLPAAPGATIAIWKRHGYNGNDMDETANGGSGMDPKELAKALETSEVQIAALTKRAETAEATAAAITKAATDAGFLVDGATITKRADPEYVEFHGEKFEKSAVPAAVLKAVEQLISDNAKMKAESQLTALAKRGADELPHLAGTDLAKGRLLEVIGADAEMLKALKAADAVMAKAAKEIGGNSQTDEASATYRLNKMASDHATAKGVTFETAYAEITKSGEGLRLVSESRAEMN